MHNTSMQLLLVEDDAPTLERIEPLLNSRGISHVIVSTAAEARVAMDVLFFPVVVIDRMLGDRHALELCQAVRRSDRDGRVYVIVLSGLNCAADLAECLAAGADDYLSRHAPDAELFERLEIAIRYARLPRKP